MIDGPALSMSDSDLNATPAATETQEATARGAAERDRLLDEALQETFPASDPVSLVYRQATPATPSRAATNHRPSSSI